MGRGEPNSCSRVLPTRPDWEDGLTFRKKDSLVGTLVLQERDSGPPARRIVTLQIDAADADASRYEPVWKGERRCGFVTSGAYGHCVDASLAMAFLDRDCSENGTDLTCHVVGDRRSAKVIAPSPFDPDGQRCRS